MRDITIKVDGTTNLSAGDWNANQAELENIVTSTDQTLDPAGGADTDLNMLPKAVAGYAGAGWAYQDSGSANTYVLSIASNLKPITKYFDNLMVAFLPGNDCTGASTANVAGLGAKAIKINGVDPTAGEISTDRIVILKFNLSSDYFELVTGALENKIQAASFGRNHLPGGSFESWSAGISNQAPDGWELIGTPTDVSRDTGERDGYGGIYSEKIISGGASNEGTKATLSKLKPSQIYTVLARGKATAGDTAKIWTTGASANLSQTTTNTDFTTLKGTFLTDATPTDVVLKTGSDNSGDIVWFDMILIIEGGVESPYIPHINDRFPLAVDYQDITPTNFVYGQMRIQTGRALTSGGGDITVTYPRAFKQNPTVLATAEYAEGEQMLPRVAATPSPTSFNLSTLNNNGARVIKNVHWLTIGVA